MKTDLVKLQTIVFKVKNVFQNNYTVNLFN